MDFTYRRAAPAAPAEVQHVNMTEYWDHPDAQRAARERLDEAAEIEAEIAERSARLAPYRRRWRWRLSAIRRRVVFHLFALADRVRAMAAALRRRTAERRNMKGNADG